MLAPVVRSARLLPLVGGGGGVDSGQLSGKARSPVAVEVDEEALAPQDGGAEERGGGSSPAVEEYPLRLHAGATAQSSSQWGWVRTGEQHVSTANKPGGGSRF